MPPAVDVDRVARAVVLCLTHPTPEVRVGWTGRVVSMSERIAPPLYDRLIGPVFEFLAFRRRPRADYLGNLFDPSRGAHRPTPH